MTFCLGLMIFTLRFDGDSVWPGETTACRVDDFRRKGTWGLTCSIELFFKRYFGNFYFKVRYCFHLVLRYAVFNPFGSRCSVKEDPSRYCVFSHDVMAAIFVSQNKEKMAMFVSQTSPVGVELFSYVKAFFCSKKFT